MLWARSSRYLDEHEAELAADAGTTNQPIVAPASAASSSSRGISAAGEAGWQQRWEREKQAARAEKNPGRYHEHGGPRGGHLAALMAGVAPWQRLMGALIVRAVLGQGDRAVSTTVCEERSGDDANGQICGVAALSSPSSPSSSSLSSLPSYGLLLSLLPPPQSQPAMCPLREATATLRALLSDSPGNQAAAVEAGVISAMVHVSVWGSPG